MDLGLYMQFVLALVFVLALIGVLAILARRFGFGYGTPAKGGPRGRRRRLSVSEIVPLDAKRKLVLLRRDSVEHLVILGPTSETVVETAIAVPPEDFAAAVTAATAAPTVTAATAAPTVTAATAAPTMTAATAAPTMTAATAAPPAQAETPR
jgi:flagellar protein FliO/FliZ